MDGLQAGGAFEITCVFREWVHVSSRELRVRTVNDHNLLGCLLLRESVEDQVHRLTEDNAVCAELLGRSDVQIGEGIGLDVVEDIGSELLRVAPSLEVLESALDRDNVVTMGAAFNVRNLRSRISMVLSVILILQLTPGAILRLQITNTPVSENVRCQAEHPLTSRGAFVSDNLAKSSPESIDVFAIHSHDLEAVTLEGLGNLVALKVLGRVTGDGDIVVVDDQLHVQALRDCETGGLGVVSFLSPCETVRRTCERLRESGVPAGNRRNQA